MLPTCRRIKTEQVAEWQVNTDSNLVSGYWINYGTSSNQEIVQFTTEEGKVPCVPGEPFPEEYTIVGRQDTGQGETHGPFMLKPTRYSGYWVGEWRVVRFGDGTALFTAEAKGYTAWLEGRELRVYSGVYRIGTPPPFKGWILTPVGND